MGKGVGEREREGEKEVSCGVEYQTDGIMGYVRLHRTPGGHPKPDHCWHVMGYSSEVGF